jgi:succinate dehydrogenase/fumarate reductase cytochrome b subunit
MIAFKWIFAVGVVMFSLCLVCGGLIFTFMEFQLIPEGPPPQRLIQMMVISVWAMAVGGLALWVAELRR